MLDRATQELTIVNLEPLIGSEVHGAKEEILSGRMHRTTLIGEEPFA